MTRDEHSRGDLRVQRTRQLIIDALTELTIEKGFAAVTVQEIVARAGINRATFYRHYEDKFDLLDQYARAVYQLADHSSDGKTAEGADAPFEQAAAGLPRLLEHVRDHANFFRVMLGPKGDPAFTAKIRRYIENRIRRSLPTALRSDANSADLYLSYVSSGAVGVLSWWLEHDTPHSPEELAAIMYRFISADLAALNQPGVSI